jgi:hypothetical protein
MGLLLTFGGVLGFLPIVGFWMVPIGLALLADDVQLLRSDPEFSIGSNIAVHIGCLVDLARNDPS